MDFLEKLEAFKRAGYYTVTFTYGEGTGCDDLSVPMLDRRVRLLAVPVGVTGECRVAYCGKVKDFLTFDFSVFPEELSNPPDELGINKIEQGGWYIWGTDSLNHLREVVWLGLQGKK